MNFDIRKKTDFSDMWKDTNFGDINFDILTLVIYCIYILILIYGKRLTSGMLYIHIREL